VSKETTTSVLCLLGVTLKKKHGSASRNVIRTIFISLKIDCPGSAFRLCSVGCSNGANLFSRIRPRRADRVNDPTVQREMERALGGAKPADRRLVSAKRSTTHSSATSWEPPLQSHHWNAASQSRRANTHAFLYYRKAKNKNTKFKQAPDLGNV
jgi:hypothetical protein